MQRIGLDVVYTFMIQIARYVYYAGNVGFVKLKSSITTIANYCHHSGSPKQTLYPPILSGGPLALLPGMLLQSQDFQSLILRVLAINVVMRSL